MFLQNITIILTQNKLRCPWNGLQFCTSIRCTDWSLSRASRMLCNSWASAAVWSASASAEIPALRRMPEDEASGGGKLSAPEKQGQI